MPSVSEKPHVFDDDDHDPNVVSHDDADDDFVNKKVYPLSPHIYVIHAISRTGVMFWRWSWWWLNDHDDVYNDYPMYMFTKANDDHDAVVYER